MSNIYPAPTARTNRIIAALPADEGTNLRGLATEIDLAANTILFEAGGTLNHVYFPEDGLVSLLIVMPGGSVAEVGFVGSEGALVTSYHASTRKSLTRATVVSAGKALRISIELFEKMLDKSSAFRQLIANNNIRILEIGHQIAACNLLHQLEPRLCRWLLQVFDNGRNDSAVITQESLAQMLGVNRARLNEALKVLQKLGAIAQPRRGSLTIIDANLVAERVCDCYRLLRIQNRR